VSQEREMSVDLASQLRLRRDLARPPLACQVGVAV